MNKRWRIHEETLAEVEGTVAWYDAQRVGLDLEFLDELRRTLADLREAPALSTPDRAAPAAASVRRRGLRRFPYAVVFAESPTEYDRALSRRASTRAYWHERLDSGEDTSFPAPVQNPKPGVLNLKP